MEALPLEEGVEGCEGSSRQRVWTSLKEEQEKEEEKDDEDDVL